MTLGRKYRNISVTLNLETDCVKRLTEARVNYLEKMLNIGQNPYYQRVFLPEDECQAELKTENHFRV